MKMKESFCRKFSFPFYLKRDTQQGRTKAKPVEIDKTGSDVNRKLRKAVLENEELTEMVDHLVGSIEELRKKYTVAEQNKSRLQCVCASLLAHHRLNVSDLAHSDVSLSLSNDQKRTSVRTTSTYADSHCFTIDESEIMVCINELNSLGLETSSNPGLRRDCQDHVSCGEVIQNTPRSNSYSTKCLAAKSDAASGFLYGTTACFSHYTQLKNDSLQRTRHGSIRERHSFCKLLMAKGFANHEAFRCNKLESNSDSSQNYLGDCKVQGQHSGIDNSMLLDLNTIQYDRQVSKECDSNLDVASKPVLIKHCLTSRKLN